MKRIAIVAGFSLLSLSVKAQTLTNVPVETGIYTADLESLKQWECPEWYRNAKFGIWAHWGPQCEAEAGDWYARNMYYEGTGQYNYHVQNYGDPSQFGLKELCNAWKAEEWNPDELIALYKSVGAQFFFTLGQHHDNFDLWNSPYQEWNSVNVGPKKDIIKGWADACKKYGLPLGVSIHGSHTWTWLEGSQKYDGNLTREDGYTLNADGTEKWWKGLDPQELYAQNHDHSAGWENAGTIFRQWEWGNGAALPSQAFMTKLQNRIMELINDYDPQLIYFDDTVLPFYDIDPQIGRTILAHYYNHSANRNGGKAQVVPMGKILNDEQKEFMLWDVERGIPDRMQPLPWQTCTCIGQWHYDQGMYRQNRYKSAATVVRMLVDVASKNGCLLLNIPVKGNGTIDDKERAILAGIKAWMDVNKESLYDTRHWKVFGEGPLAESVNPLNSQGFNEGFNYTSDDIRFNTKENTLYATMMAWPKSNQTTITSLAITSPYYSGKVNSVTLLGYGAVDFTMDDQGLHVSLPSSARPGGDIAPVLAITFADLDDSAAIFDELTNSIRLQLTAIAAHADENTGHFSPRAVQRMQQVFDAAIADTQTSKDTLMDQLRQAWQQLLANGKNQGGAPESGFDDLTQKMLVEATEFSRTDASTTRFGAPKYWTVENFCIPQTNADGTKQGIDKYNGHSSLMLGVWDDRDRNSEGDLANARIYRKVTLPRGRYFFGAAYNQIYGLADNAYIFAANTTVDVNEVEENAIAYDYLKNASSNLQMRGIYFTLDKEQEVVLGFTADLAHGAAEQEFRAQTVALYTYSEPISSDYYSEPAAGTFYLYNVTKRQFLTETPAMSLTPVPLTLATVSDTEYSIAASANRYLKMGYWGGQYLWNNAGYQDTGYFAWTFSPCGDKTYNMNITAKQDADGYFTAGVTYYFNSVNTAPSTAAEDADEWALISPSDYETYYTNSPAAKKNIIINAKGDATALVANPTFDSSADGWSGGTRTNCNTWRGNNGWDYESTSETTFTQTIHNMPAGTYKLVAAVRGDYHTTATATLNGTSGTTVENQAFDVSRQQINTNGVQMPYSSLGGFNYGSNALGWQWATTTYTMETDGDLILGFVMTGNGWKGIDDVHLYYMSDGTNPYAIEYSEGIDNTNHIVTCDIQTDNPNKIYASTIDIKTATSPSTILNNFRHSNGFINNLVLYEEYDLTVPANTRAVESTFYCNIPAETIATICVPFDIVSATDGTFYQPERLIGDNTLNFESVDSKERGKAYLYKAVSAVTSLKGPHDGYLVPTPVNNDVPISMRGTFTTVGAPYNSYVLSEGKLSLVNSDVTVAPFCAYFNIQASSTLKETLNITLDHDATAIQTMEKTAGQNVYYDLQGRVVQNPSRGIYIQNKKKILIK